MTSPIDNVSSLDSASSSQDAQGATFEDFIAKADSDAAGKDTPQPSQDAQAQTAEHTDIATRSVILPEQMDVTGKTGKDKQPDAEKLGPQGWDAIMGEGNPASGDLDKPLVMARKLLDNWENWRMHEGTKFAGPDDLPHDLPDEAKETLKYFADSQTARTALANGFDTDKKAGDTISRYEVGEFIKRAESDIAAAGKAYQEFLKKNGDADGPAKALAQSAAILMANQSLVASSGERMIGGAEDQRENNRGIHPSNLAGAVSDASLSQALRDAAATWKSSGMRSVLDVAGGSPLTTAYDRVVGRDNIASWLENAAPSSAEGVVDMIQQAAFDGLASGAKSLSGEDKKNFFKNLDSHSTEEKAGVLAELTQAAARLEAGKDAGIWGKVRGDTIDDDHGSVQRDLQSKIERLAEDPDVRTHIANARVDGLRDVVDESPELKEQLQQYFNNEFSNGVQLRDIDFSKLDGDQPASADDIKALGAELAQFARDAALLDSALGGDGSPDLSEALKSTGRYEQLEALYQDVKSGKVLSEQMANGASIEDALRDFAVSGAGLSAFFGNGGTEGPHNDSNGLIGGMGNAFINQANASDLDVFRGPDGEIDEAELTEFIEDAVKANPDLFVTDKAAPPVSPNQIAGLVKSIATAMNTGLSARDAMAKLGLIEEGTAMPPKVLANAHGNGVLQGAGAVLASGVLLTRLLTGNNETAKEKASVVGNALTMFGATGSFIAKTGTGVTQDLLAPLLKAGSPLISAAGSTIGGVMGLISGVDQLKSGNKALGALGLTDGIVGTGLAVLEGAAAVAGALGLSGAGTLSAISGALGPIGWVAGVTLTVAQIAVGSAIRQQQTHDYVSTVSSVLNPYGIGQEQDWDSRISTDKRDPIFAHNKF